MFLFFLEWVSFAGVVYFLVKFCFETRPFLAKAGLESLTLLNHLPNAGAIGMGTMPDHGVLKYTIVAGHGHDYHVAIHTACSECNRKI